MIVTRPEDFLAAIANGAISADQPATARAAFMVSPLDFSLADESASDNRYMDMSNPPDALRALAEHAHLARRLAEDVPVVTFPGDPEAPDGAFPNNAFASIHGRLIVGHMRHAVRQRETARADIRRWFVDMLGCQVVDLSTRDLVAELTGSLVIDRARGIGFCGLGERCDMAGARAMHDAFGLRLTYCFELAAGEYHTNVVLAILAGRAAMIAPSGFRDGQAAQAIATLYPERTLWISASQKEAFAANAISLGPQRVWMSTRAGASLTDAQRALLSRCGFTIASVDLDEIEKAGGSLRCCVGEIY